MDRSLYRQVLIGVICNLLIIDSGFHEGWSTPMVDKLQFKDPDVTITNEQSTWVVNLLYVGVGVGSIIPLLLMDTIGRKWTMFVAAIPKIGSWIIFAFGRDYRAFYVGRLLAGVGTGITYCVTPMYIGEISTKRTRGPLSASLAVWINIGMLTVYAIGLGTSRLTMSAISIVVPILFTFCFAWLPKSAVFLAKKQRFGKAAKVLKWSLGKDDVEEEMEEIKRIVASQESTIGFWRSCRESYRRVEARRAFNITGILLSAMIFSGAAPVLAFSFKTFEQAEYEALSPELSVIYTGVAIVIAGIGCVLAVKYTGKRGLLLWAAPVSILCLCAIAGFFTVKNSGGDVSNWNFIPTVAIMFYALAYGIALNPLPLSYISEVFPMDVKVPAALYCSLFYAAGSILVVKMYEILDTSYGLAAPFWFFASIMMVLWLLIYLYVPETEGKSLEEIQMELRGKNGSFEAKECLTDNTDSKHRY